MQIAQLNKHESVEMQNKTSPSIENIPLVTATNILQHEKRNFVSPISHVIFYLLYKCHRNTKPFYSHYKMCNLLCIHSKSDLFTFEDNMFSHITVSPGTKNYMYILLSIALKSHCTSYPNCIPVLYYKE